MTPEDQSSVPGTSISWLTIAYNSSSMGTNALFQTLQVPTYAALIHTDTQA